MTRHEPFLKELRGLLDARGLTQDPETIEPWLTDWRGRYSGRALALASPSDTAALSAVLAACHRHGIAVVAQGGNSGMVGGATPDESGRALLLSLRRMDRLEVDAESRVARCGAGVVLQNLHEAAEDAGLRFPLSLGGKGSATVGGLVSTNAGGTQVLRHGMMRSLVAGLQVVLADGRVLDLATPLMKDNRGFDLKQIFIGSEGTLGVIASAVLKLVPAVARRQVVWVGLDDLHQARRLMLHCQRMMGSALEGFEVLPEDCLATVVDYLPDARRPLGAPHPWHAVLEFVADAEGADGLGDRVETTLADAIETDLLTDAVVASSETQAEAFWALRENIAPAEKAARHALQHDIAVAPAAMPAMVDELSDGLARAFPDHEVRAFGHLGDGNIHLHVLAPRDADPASWEASTGKAVSAHVYEAIAAAGGTISAEHGIGQDKLATLARTRAPAELDVMRAVKKALDPAGLLNPGKLVPPPLAPDRPSD